MTFKKTNYAFHQNSNVFAKVNSKLKKYKKTINYLHNGYSKENEIKEIKDYS